MNMVLLSQNEQLFLLINRPTIILLKVGIDLFVHKLLHRFSYDRNNRYWPVIILNNY